MNAVTFNNSSKLSVFSSMFVVDNSFIKMTKVKEDEVSLAGDTVSDIVSEVSTESKTTETDLEIVGLEDLDAETKVVNRVLKALIQKAFFSTPVLDTLPLNKNTSYKEFLSKIDVEKMQEILLMESIDKGYSEGLPSGMVIEDLITMSTVGGQYGGYESSGVIKTVYRARLSEL